MALTPYKWRPIGTSSAGDWVATGAASLHAALSDASDGSYITTTSSSYCVLFMDDPDALGTFPALSQIRSAQFFVRGYSTGGSNPENGDFRWRFATGYPHGSLVTLLTIEVVNTAIADNASSILTTNPISGSAWTAVDFDWLNFLASSQNAWTGRIHDVWADIIYNEAPVATPTLPTGAQSTSRPTVEWTYTDPESDAQERYQVKVFSAAEYGVGGFDPETSPSSWASGGVLSSATSTVVGADLVNGTTYKAYVKTADVGSNGRYGNWVAGPTFDIDTTPPPVPTLTAVADDANARVQLEATVGSFTDPQTVILQRSVDEGVTWTVVRGGADLAPVGSVAALGDYEAPRGVIVQYRTRAVSIVGGNQLASAWTAAEIATLTLSGWWLKDPLDPALNVQVAASPPFDFQRKHPQAIYEPLGRRSSVVVGDGVKGIAGELHLWAKNAAESFAIEAILAAGRTLLLQDVLGRQWYVRFGPQGWQLIRAAPVDAAAIRHFHRVDLSFVEVGSPS